MGVCTRAFYCSRILSVENQRRVQHTSVSVVYNSLIIYSQSTRFPSELSITAKNKSVYFMENGPLAQKTEYVTSTSFTALMGRAKATLLGNRVSCYKPQYAVAGLLAENVTATRQPVLGWLTSFNDRSFGTVPVLDADCMPVVRWWFLFCKYKRYFA